VTGQFLYASDLNDLNDYLVFLRRLADSMRSFKTNLGLVAARDYGSYTIPDLEKQLREAADQSSGWLIVWKALVGFSSELEAFIAHTLGTSQAILESRQPDSAPFIATTGKRLGTLIDPLANHQQALDHLTRGIYTLVPRILDIMNSDLDRHARQYNLKEPDVSVPYKWSGPPLSATARLAAGRRHAKSLHTHYRAAYGAATNIGSYVSRLLDLLRTCREQTLKLRQDKNTADLHLHLRLLGVELREIRRIVGQFNSLAGATPLTQA
jgi:hypothetical protein